MLFYVASGFGNASPGQDYVGRRSRLVIRNIRDAGTPVKRATKIRTVGDRQNVASDGRKPKILRTSNQGWSARNQRTAPRTKNRVVSQQRTVKKRSAFTNRPSPPRFAPAKSPLRWRRPDDQGLTVRPSRRPVQSAHRGTRQASSASSQTVRNEQATSSIRRAAHLAPLDPFDDPFGDQQAQHTETLPQPRTQSVLQPQRQPARSFQNQDDPPSPLFETGAGKGAPEPPMKTIKRDCAAEIARCKTIERNPLSTISLDITPSLRSSTVRGDNAAAKRQLRTARARTWKNRAGDIVAEGKLSNLEFGRAVITDTDGSSRRVPVNHLSDADLCVVATLWNLPAECVLDQDPYVPRKWIPSTMTWKASALCYRPLYFEQVQLERYGHTAGPITQPILSGAHFFTSLAALPYKMGINPPTECRYPLGYYRPGNCAPWLMPPVPLSVRGALWEAGVITGGVSLLP